MPDSARRLVVGRLRKPHGLKGECAVFPLTDRPDEVFHPGRRLWMMTLDGQPMGPPLTIERGRAYHREWLLKFEGVDTRTALDALPGGRGLFLAADERELTPPDDDEVYLHELVGFAVGDQTGAALGIVSDVFDLPTGLTLEIQGPAKEFLLPYKREFVVEVHRASRRLTVALPAGLMD